MFWQKLSYLPACVVTGTLAIANVDYFHGLGSPHSYFSVAGVDISRADIMAALGVGIDIVMVMAAMAIMHWAAHRRRVNVLAALIVWLICSGISGHSLYGWIRTNIADTQTPVARSQDLYDSIIADIKVERRRLQGLYGDRENTKFHKERKRLSHEATVVQRRIDDLRSKLDYAPKIEAVANPIKGFEIAVSVGLWLLSALLWPALYGFGGEGKSPNDPRKNRPPDDDEEPGDDEGNHEGKVIPFTDPKAEIAQWLKDNTRPRKDARVKALDVYWAFRSSSRAGMTDQKFYKVMKALLPTKNRKRIGAGVHYLGFELVEGRPRAAA